MAVPTLAMTYEDLMKEISYEIGNGPRWFRPMPGNWPTLRRSWSGRFVAGSSRRSTSSGGCTVGRS
jgi:hypothetical protein